jgi:hypothetical protein
MSLGIKLSTAQHELLNERRGRFAPNYKTGIKLKELGFIECQEKGFYLSWTITQKGLDYLMQNKA